MEPSSEGNLSLTEDSVKSLIPITSVKKEEPEDERLDATIAIFDDVEVIGNWPTARAATTLPFQFPGHAEQGFAWVGGVRGVGSKNHQKG